MVFLSGTDLLASVSDDRSVRIWREGNQVAVMYGHTARIWKVTGNQATVITSSEDATVRVWDISGLATSGQVLERACLCSHIGKNVRAIDFVEDVIVSGGEDSSIVLTNLKSIGKNNDEDTDFKLQISVPDAQAGSKDQNLIKAVKFKKSDQLVFLATSKGTCLKVDCITQS